MSRSQILDDARALRDLLDEEKRWCRACVAVRPQLHAGVPTGLQEPCDVMDVAATRFCLVGGCRRVTGDDYYRSEALLGRLARRAGLASYDPGRRWLGAWNDMHSHAQVTRATRELVAELEEEEENYAAP